ncbi:MAG: glycosyltransferase family 2 protein [Bacillota bacterium]|jgi:glycosyltransferase involved in cell wall biosynthesis
MSVSAVIPAFNEENTVGGIVSVLTTVPEISEIIVVSDGSTDATSEVARRAGAHVIELQKNLGKGGAMKVGINACRFDIVLFLDADLIGLTTDHVKSLIYPVISRQAAVTIGIFGKGRLATDLAQFLAPYLSGQRCVRKELLTQIDCLEATRFGVEVALTKYVKEHNIDTMEIDLAGMSHVMKEEKMGFAKGLAARMKMYWEIAKMVKETNGTKERE